MSRSQQLALHNLSSMFCFFCPDATVLGNVLQKSFPFWGSVEENYYSFVSFQNILCFW